MVPCANSVNQVMIIIPDSDDEEHISKKPSPAPKKKHIKALASLKTKVHFYDYMSALATAELRHFMTIIYVCCLL
jgi:hypothetical protein